MSQKDKPQEHFAQEEYLASAPPKASHRSPRFLPFIVSSAFKHPFKALCVLSLIASLVFCLIAPAFSAAAGITMGSWNGVTQGISKGYEAGVEKGLSAEDTTVKIGTKMAETGNLQVMLVDLKLADIYQSNTYAILWGIEGNGIFSVDLTQATVHYDEKIGQVEIVLPEPVPTVSFDDCTAETIAEYKSSLFNGSTSAGYISYLNSRSQIEQKAQEQMLGLREAAKGSASNQVKKLAESICGKGISVQISFAESEE